EFLPNTFAPGSEDPCPACPAGFVYIASNGSSLRNAGQIQVRRRLHSGLSASLSYTLALATDDAAAFVVNSTGVQSSNVIGVANAYIAQDWTNLAAERGPSSFDQRHVVAANVEYTTGMGLTGGALMDGRLGALFRGWTTTAQLVAGSGLPATPIYLA